MARTLQMRCVDCGCAATQNERAARKLGWTLWLGGGRCPKCSAAIVAPPLAIVLPPRVFVTCVGCSGVFASFREHVDGWRPMTHWIAAPAGQHKICPGVEKGAPVVDQYAIAIELALAGFMAPR